MTIGSFCGFPGDWTYQGKAKLLLKDTVQLVTVSLRFIFTEQSEIDVEIIWDDFSREEQVEIGLKMDRGQTQVLSIQESILLIGFSIPPFNINRTTKFNVIKIISYYQFQTDSSMQEDDKYFAELKAYLNDGISSDDEIFAEEFEGIPFRNINQKGVQPIYCKLNSGYEVRCGKKYITHKDHQTSHYTKNIETLYRLSFIDISLPLKSNDMIADDNKNIEASLFKHLEDLFNYACAFLSVVCDREILPIYYDYSIYKHNKYTEGRIIPIWSRRKILKVNKLWFAHETHLMGNITAFLECCPISKQLSRGIQHLKLTVYESPAELKLMASCSAIEYFYSFWFWNMNGKQKLIYAATQKNTLISDKISVKMIEKIKVVTDKTPYLSTIIRFFIDDLGINYKKYISSEKEAPKFIEIRNGLLHGSFISDDTVMFQAEEIAQKLGTEILFAIMKTNSKSDDSWLYETLPIRTPEEVFYSLSDGWIELQKVLDNLD
ncbi:MAG: hypothetical protein IM539_05600 [Pseudanabaena sp. M046S1SP1A06QC]|jgi:hypothetical protein|nr:hypothetical protein [Pseudanabaena sp. M046S1SP1A06QC]